MAQAMRVSGHAHTRSHAAPASAWHVRTAQPCLHAGRPARGHQTVHCRTMDHEPACSSAQTHRGLAGIAACVLASAALLTPSPAFAYQLEATEQTFNMKCIGCHAGGGNVLAVGQSLFTEDLQRNGNLDPDALFTLVYKGKGKMPGFGKECAPKGQCTFGPRLTDEEIQDLATYVLAKAEAGWK